MASNRGLAVICGRKNPHLAGFGVVSSKTFKNVPTILEKIFGDIVLKIVFMNFE